MTGSSDTQRPPGRVIGVDLGGTKILTGVVDDAGFKNVSTIPVLAWTAFALTLFAGLSMVTNAPFYSFKVIGRQLPYWRTEDAAFVNGAQLATKGGGCGQAR